MSNHDPPQHTQGPLPPLIITTDSDGPAHQANSAIRAETTPSRHGRADSELSDSTHLSPLHAHPSSTWQSQSSPLGPPSPTFSSSSSAHGSDDLRTPTSTCAPETTLQGDGDGNPISENVPLHDAKEHRPSISATTWDSSSPFPPSPSSRRDLSLATTKYSLDDKKKSSGKGGKEDKEKEAPPSAHLDPDQDMTDTTPFSENPSRLAMLVDPKSVTDLEKIGGINGLLDGLGVDPTNGLSPEDAGSAGAPRSSAEMAAGKGPQYSATLEDRRRVYGRNDLPERKSKTFLQLMWAAFNDKVLILLTIAAIVSLALGIYTTLDPHNHEEHPCANDPTKMCTDPKVEWVEGVAIVVAITIVVVVGSVNDWQKERQFKKLNEKREDRKIKVIRGGNEMLIHISDVVVGDLGVLDPGEVIPVDGVFLRGHNVRCDESGATGESDAIKKTTYDECILEQKGLAPGQHGKLDCFLISGSKVLEGVGVYVVIAVGTKSFNGRILVSMRQDSESTPLQLKLNRLADLIAYFGGISGLLLFIALMIRFFVQLRTMPGRTAAAKAQQFVQILIIAVTLVVVAIPEGLPLAVTLALAFATKRMTKQNLLVRVLGSCETMGHANVICTDKTGTLTTNVMTVVAGSFGVSCKYVRELEENSGRTLSSSEADRTDFSIDMNEINTVTSPELQKLYNEAICLNSTAFEEVSEDGKSEFVGSKTETALLRFAQDLGWQNYKTTRGSAEIVQMVPFSSELKAMCIVIKTETGYRMYIKGASEVLVKRSSSFVHVSRTPTTGVQVEEFNDATLANINNTIIFYANQSLRTLAIAYRDFPQWPPAGAEDCAMDAVPYELISNNLTLIGIAAIEDPLRSGVSQAVADCQHAGVAVKMCTGDNVLTARSIGRQCGIFTPGGIVMEGPVFRKLSDADLLMIVPRLQILARSSPEDKKLLVRTLKRMGQVVAVTGDGTNDGPALKLANVGFAMGITGTEVAKEASDIIIMDDSFASIVTAIMWGRCVNDAVKKFLQFQLSVNVTAVVITFVSAVASDKEESVLSAVQLLWVNLIMDTFAALALATDPATRSLLNRPPDGKNSPLLTVEMIKMIVGQAIYQIIICLVLHFVGYEILGMDRHDPTDQAELKSLVFNVFVFCQIFNQLNCRRLDRRFNVLEGFFKNVWFMSIFLIMLVGQIIIVFVGGAAFQVRRINGRDWGISIIAGLLSLPIGAIIRMIPTKPLENFLVRCKLYPDPNKLPTVAPDADDEDQSQDRGDGWEFSPAIQQVKDNLATFSAIRGGRIRGSSVVLRSRTAQLEEANIRPTSLLAMVPTLVGGIVGAGTTWIQQTNKVALQNPAQQEATRSTTDLYAGRVQLHPDTDPNDPLWAKFGLTPPSSKSLQ